MSFTRRPDVLSDYSVVFFLRRTNIKRLSISLCLRCCIKDILYNFKWKSNLEILCTLDLLQVNLCLHHLTLSSVSFLTSCIAAGFLTDRGLLSLEMSGFLYRHVFFSNLLTVRRIHVHCLLGCFNPGYIFYIVLITSTEVCVLQ